ncbi:MULTISPECIES: hypothetical protein [Chelativorans]|jgi:predicted small lipoprotein YifL|nr:MULTISPECIES: hypothetical protein [Chelativorans]
MKKVFITLVAVFAATTLAACVGKGKGKAPPPAPVVAEEPAPAPVYK